MNGKDRCEVERTNWIDVLKPYVDIPHVSGAYREDDWQNRHFSRLREMLITYGDNMPKMRLWEHVRALMFLGNVNGKHILDIGTRESVIPAYLACQGATVTACDLHPEAIVHRKNVTVEKADARDLPFEDESFDVVLSTACLKHVPGWGDRTAIREMARVVKPHGLVAVSFDFGPDYRPTPSDISGRRIYDADSVQSRLVSPSGLSLVGPESWDVRWDAPKDTWPIKSQAKSIWDKDYNLQVGFILLRKE